MGAFGFVQVHLNVWVVGLRQANSRPKFKFCKGNYQRYALRNLTRCTAVSRQAVLILVLSEDAMSEFLRTSMHPMDFDILPAEIFSPVSVKPKSELLELNWQ
ncbi:MAG: hypothetical protein ACKVQW_14735 [Pyrinomonadaceae bacterium]